MNVYGYEKPTSGIPLSDLSSAVQTSLGKADTALQSSDLVSKQDTLVSGTNIKTVNGTSLLGSGDVSIPSGGTLTDVIRSTDGNLSAVVNTWYHWDISGLTADRTLTLPATAAVGDKVALTVTTGDNAFEVLITAASGDTLAGVAGGTEWSRVFISGEVVVMRCVVANTTWIIEYDGRVNSRWMAYLAATVNSHYGHDADTKVPLDTVVSNVGDIGNISTDQVTVRRSGYYDISGSAAISGITGTGVYIVLTLNASGTYYMGSTTTRATTGVTNQYTNFRFAGLYLTVGTVLHLELYQNDGASRAAFGYQRYTNLSVSECL